MDKIHILSFAGSLRKGSYNRSLLRAASELAPPEVEIEIYDLEGLPLYNQDLENAPSAKVKEFKEKLRSADAILIATPEYNYSISGILKNALDIASRPYGDNSLNGKPLGIIGASVGMMGTVRAQSHLRQFCTVLNMHPMNNPEILVSAAKDKFDNYGKLTDQETKDRIRKFLEALVIWTKRLKK
jgi:chromate reductase